MRANAEWTFMVYMAGDNNLSDAGDTDLDEMCAAGSSDKVNVLAEFDNAGDRGTVRYQVQGGAKVPVQSLGETDSGSPTVLLDFFRWAIDNYPAERYALILWNHGGGWEPTEMDRIARTAGARNYSVREATERSSSALRRAFFRPTLETILGLASAADRAICCDDGSGHSLDTVELGKVLAKAAETIGRPLDLLGMDACLMSNLEVAYQARPYVRYIVASEESEPGDGWPYDLVLGRLAAEPRISTASLAAHIVDAYIQWYVARHYSGSVTQSALDLSRLDAVTAPLDSLAEALIARLPAQRSKVWEAQYRSARFYYDTLWDINDFCRALPELLHDRAVRKAARQVCAALRAGPRRFVIAEGHEGPAVARCGGVSIYLPAMKEVSRYYADLDYAHDHRWPAMLQAYHTLV